MATRIQLKNVRLSYANIWRPVAPVNEPTAEPKYSVALLIDKRDKKNVGMLKKGIADALEDGRAKIANVNPRKLDKGIRDGDEKFVGVDEDSILDGYEGQWYINAKAGENYPPQIVDNRRRPISDESRVYSGCYANVFVELYTYNNQGNAGVGYGLLGIQKTADGDPLGSTFSSDLFDEFEADYEDDDDIGGQFDDDFGSSRKRRPSSRDDDWGDDGSEDFDDDDFGSSRPKGRGQRSAPKNRRRQRDDFDDYDYEDDEDFGPSPKRGKGRNNRRNTIDISDDDLPF